MPNTDPIPIWYANDTQPVTNPQRHRIDFNIGPITFNQYRSATRFIYWPGIGPIHFNHTRDTDPIPIPCANDT